MTLKTLVINNNSDMRILRFSVESYCAFLDDTVHDDSITTPQEIRENQHLSDHDLSNHLRTIGEKSRNHIKELVAIRTVLNTIERLDGVFPLTIRVTDSTELNVLDSALESYSHIVKDEADNITMSVFQFRKLTTKTDDEIKTILTENQNKANDRLDDLISMTALRDCIK